MAALLVTNDLQPDRRDRTACHAPMLNTLQAEDRG